MPKSGGKYLKFKPKVDSMDFVDSEDFVKNM